MNQADVGRYVRKKRKERNLTQEQLAEKLGVSNKTVSKWENGKCMPDYAVVEQLCGELGIGVAELLAGGDAEDAGARRRDGRQKAGLVGIVLIALGVAMLAVSRTIGGSDARDFFAGILLGLSVGEVLVGAFCIGKSLRSG